MSSRPTLLVVPRPHDPANFASVERVSAITTAALRQGAETIELEPAVVRDPGLLGRRLEALRGGIDAVFDLTGLALTGPLAPELPVIAWALGNLPRGASLLGARRRFYKTSDLLLCNSTADLRILDRALSGSGPHGRLVPFGVDCDRFRPEPDPERRRGLRRELGLPPEATVVVYAGRLNHQKGIHHLLRLFAAARDVLPEVHPGAPELRLVLAGDEDQAELREFGVRNQGCKESLERLARELGIADLVRFTGGLAHDDLARLFAAADVFASLSFHHDENFGFAPVEAMAAGLPALVSDWGGYRDTVRDGETGDRVPSFMTRNGIRVAWRRGVYCLVGLASDPARRARLGAAARAHVESALSLPAFSRALLEAVREAASRRGTPAAFGDRAFRFHPLALRLQARNALRHLTRERTGGRMEYRLAPEDYEIYRFFFGPYATADLCDAVARAGDRPAALVPFTLGPTGLELHDPVWPASMAVDPEAAQALLAVPEGGRSIGAIAAGSELEDMDVFQRRLERLLETATELVRCGVLDPGYDIAGTAVAIP